MKRILLSIGICSVLLIGSRALRAQTSGELASFDHWPKGMSPAEVGKRVAERFVTSQHDTPDMIGYPEVCAWYGALRFASETGDKALTDSLVQRFEPLFGPDQRMIPARLHVDYSVFGAVPLELYRQTKQDRYLKLGLGFADRQWEHPQPDGLSDQTRYWIDDMFMITILQVQAYRATGDRKYIDRAALEMASYLDKLQQPNGLFHHGPDVPFFWGRGNGWVAVGMAELLLSLPADNPHRERILAGYRKMMDALRRYQGKDGMWRQLIDHDDSWPETSSSAMFVFGLATGVTHGWLDRATYGPTVRHGWIALAGYVDQNNDVVNVCAGTAKTPDISYYYERPRLTGDDHGRAAVIWAATALLPSNR